MSKLICEICKIDKIENLENADRLQMATIKGWQCLVGKDLYKEGELVVFLPPDAVLPDKLIEDLKLSYLKGNNRIRTVKLRGYISQGLVLPISVLFGHDEYCYGENDCSEGEDVADILGITKYEPPVAFCSFTQPKKVKERLKELYADYKIGKISLRRLVVKSFWVIREKFKRKILTNPDFKVYTDLDNIKHYPTVFEEGEEVVISEKIHGTSTRYGFLPKKQSFINKFFKQKHEFVIGSHRVQKTVLSGKGFYGEDVYGKIAKRYNLANLIPEDYTLYGEIYGKKIQELTYGLEDIDVVFFDVKYKDKYLSFNDFVNFCVERSLPIVPILYVGSYSQVLVKHYTEGNSIIAPNQIREGCVIKPLIETNHPNTGRKILKSISTEYLLTKKQDRPEEFVDDSSEFPH